MRVQGPKAQQFECRVCSLKRGEFQSKSESLVLAIFNICSTHL